MNHWRFTTISDHSMIDLIWFNVVFLVFFESLNHADQVENHKSNNCWAVIFETCCLPYVDPYKKKGIINYLLIYHTRKSQAFMDRLDRLYMGELVCVSWEAFGEGLPGSNMSVLFTGMMRKTHSLKLTWVVVSSIFYFQPYLTNILFKWVETTN